MFHLGFAVASSDLNPHLPPSRPSVAGRILFAVLEVQLARLVGRTLLTGAFQKDLHGRVTRVLRRKNRTREGGVSGCLSFRGIG